MWRDLKRLETFAPFTLDTLTRHILSNSRDWTTFYHLPDEHNNDPNEPFFYTFDMLPNSALVRLEAYQPPPGEPSPLLISSLL